MAPEALQKASFTNKTDVWSFAVLAWEVCSLGKTPYGALGIKDMMDSLAQGNRLEPQPFTPPGLHKQMLVCWSEDPKRRPKFSDLVHLVGSIRGAIAVSPDASMTLAFDNTLVQSAAGTRHRAETIGDIEDQRSPTRVNAQQGLIINPLRTVTAFSANDDYEMFRDVNAATITRASPPGQIEPTSANDGYETFPDVNAAVLTSAPPLVAGGGGKWPEAAAAGSKTVVGLAKDGYEYETLSGDKSAAAAAKTTVVGLAKDGYEYEAVVARDVAVAGHADDGAPVSPPNATATLSPSSATLLPLPPAAVSTTLVLEATVRGLGTKPKTMVLSDDEDGGTRL
jgi:hypothetical protein